MVAIAARVAARQAARVPVAFGLRDAPLSDADQDAIITRLGPWSWFRADSALVSGGKVTALIDRIIEGHRLTQAVSANQAAAPAADARLNGRPCIEFSRTSRYVSTLSSLDVKFLHTGSGCHVFVAHHSIGNTGSTHQLVSTRGGSIGLLMQRYLGSTLSTWTRLQGFFNHTTPSRRWPIDTARVYEFFFELGRAPSYVGHAVWGGYVYGELAWSPTTHSGTVSTSTDAQLSVGHATAGFEGLFSDLIVFKRVLSDVELREVQRYFRLRYGSVYQHRRY